MQRKHANYVIQCIIKKKEWYSNLGSFNQFRNQLIMNVFHHDNISHLSTDKYASNVIETCICVSNEQQIDILINSLCLRDEANILKTMISDKFGNYIAKTLLKYCSMRQRLILVNTVHKYIINLYRYGYHVQRRTSFKYSSGFLARCQAIKYESDKQINYIQTVQ